MAIAIAGFALESVSFLATLTTRAQFEHGCLRGAALVAGLRGTATVAGGFIEVLEAAGAPILPLFWTDCPAAGPASDEAFEAFRDELLRGLEAGTPLDGVLLFLHGALVTPSNLRPELDLVRDVRRQVGGDVPIALALDYHGNLAAELADLAEIITGFHYSPHTDMAATGARAASLLLRHVEGSIRAATVITKVPIILPSILSATSLHPLCDFVARTVRPPSSVLDASLFNGFAYADSPDLGMTLTAVTDIALRAAASAWLGGLSREIVLARGALMNALEIVDLESGVARALALQDTGARPIVLLEHADRMNDSTFVLRALHERRARRVFVPWLFDAESAAAALEAGPGAMIEVALGGHSYDESGGPLACTAEVLSAGAKRFVGTGPMRAGRAIDLGVCAVLRIGGITVSVTSTSASAIDFDCLDAFDLDLADFDLVLLRSKTHFRAVWEEAAAAILVIDTKDWGRANLESLPYAHPPRDLFPPGQGQPGRSEPT